MITFVLDITVAYFLAKKLKRSWIIFLLCVPIALINSITANTLIALSVCATKSWTDFVHFRVS